MTIGDDLLYLDFRVNWAAIPKSNQLLSNWAKRCPGRFGPRFVLCSFWTLIMLSRQRINEWIESGLRHHWLGYPFYWSQRPKLILPINCHFRNWTPRSYLYYWSYFATSKVLNWYKPFGSNLIFWETILWSN